MGEVHGEERLFTKLFLLINKKNINHDKFQDFDNMFLMQYLFFCSNSLALEFI